MMAESLGNAEVSNRPSAPVGGVAHPGEGNPGQAQAAPPLEWTINSWREDLRRGVLAVLSLLLMWAVLYSLHIVPLMTVALGLAVFAYLSPGFSPWRCRVDADGVAVRRFFVWDRRPWGQIRRARVSSGGLFVSPYSRPRLLDSFRALFLPIPRSFEHRDRLLSELRRRLTEHGL